MQMPRSFKVDSIKNNSEAPPWDEVRESCEACVSVHLKGLLLWAATGQEIKCFCVIRTEK